MTKKTAKTVAVEAIEESAAEKSPEKKSGKKKKSARSRNETNPAKVRKEVSKIVKARAVEMAEAVIGETEEGAVSKEIGLATVKYLFEVAAIYPPQSDQDQATADEDCLAKTLLRKLNIPEEPVVHDEDEEEEIPVAKVDEIEGETKADPV